MIDRLKKLINKLPGIRKLKDSGIEPIPLYEYYEIKYDTSYSQKAERIKVVKAILDTGMFKQTNHQTFKSKKRSPWTDLLIVETKDGSYSSSDRVNQFVNLITIVCLDESSIEQEKYIPIFLRIAHQLNWKLYLTRDENGNEDVEITK
jgi:hypothetical protein